MRIGDLVELSACGESTDYNRSFIGKLGIRFLQHDGH
jgi:hypothetical protein